MSLSEDDRKFIGKAVEIRDEHIQVIVDAAISKHEKGAIFHNPIKAILAFSGLAAIYEQARKFFSH